MKVTFPSNTASTLEMIDFPEEVIKGAYNVFKLATSDTDGFVSKVYCDFNDSNGEQNIFSGVSNDYGNSDFRKAVTYTEDGNYNIECKVYDNEGLATNFSKSFTIGTVVVEPVEEEVVVEDTNTSCSIDSIWEQREGFNPAYCPSVGDDGAILLPFSPWTNGRLGGDGYYDGNSIITKSKYDLLGKTIQIKFSLDGVDNYFASYIGLSLTTPMPYTYLSTDHVWSITTLVEHNRAIYYQMVIDSEGLYSLTISYIGYGQSDISTKSGTLTAEQISAASETNIFFTNGDNYGGVSANATLYEMQIIENLSSTTCDFSSDNWEQRDVNYLSGATYSFENEQHILNGAVWNNGCDRLQPGCDGNGIVTKTSCNMLGQTIKTKFKVNSDLYAAYWVKPQALSGYTYYNTHHSWRDGKVIASDTWVYQTLTISDSGAWSMILSEDSYDGNILHQQTGQATDSTIKLLADDKFYLTFTDNYAGLNASMTIAEITSERIVGSDGGAATIATIPDDFIVVEIIELADFIKKDEPDERVDVAPTGINIITDDEEFGQKDENSSFDVTSSDGDANRTITLETKPESFVFENENGGVTSLININKDVDMTINININGTLDGLLSFMENGKQYLTQLLVDVLGADMIVNKDGSTLTTIPRKVSPLNQNVDIEIYTDSLGKVTPKYNIDNKLIELPTFSKGSVVNLKEENDKLNIEVKTVLSSPITFN